MVVPQRGRAGRSGDPGPAHHENPFEDVVEQVDQAARVLGLVPEDVEVLKHPKRQVTVSLPVRMDDGRLHLHRYGCSTTRPAAPARAASVTTPAWT